MALIRRFSIHGSRLLSTATSFLSEMEMNAWQISDYGEAPELRSLTFPTISGPKDVLIKVNAASINPIDIRMQGGYGREIIGFMRRCESLLKGQEHRDFPLVLGRDFSGTVVDVGANVGTFRKGDEVFGTVPAERRGAFADYVVADRNWICSKPNGITHAEAASLPYVAVTTMSALRMACRNGKSLSGKRVLVHGGSGGIGTFFTQFATSHGAIVTATCSEETGDFVKSLGAKHTVDYNQSDAFDNLIDFGPFDLILDPISSSLSLQSTELLGLWRNCVYITLATPLLKDSDDLGFPFGLAKSAVRFGSELFKLGTSGRVIVWGFYSPFRSSEFLSEIKELVESNKIKPVIGKEIPWSDIGLALQGNWRGKQGKTVAVI